MFFNDLIRLPFDHGGQLHRRAIGLLYRRDTDKEDSPQRAIRDSLCDMCDCSGAVYDPPIQAPLKPQKENEEYEEVIGHFG